MNAVVKLTGYAKAPERLETIVTVPESLVPFARAVAGVPETGPRVLAMYPLTISHAAAIATEAKLALDPDRFDYCLEAVAEDDHFKAAEV
jgi:hypothetical protein